MDTDVLVVGAGPTGLMLANQLARRGVRVTIIDRHAGPSLQTRALGVQARTLEIYAHLDIVSQALALGKRATGANFWAEGKRGARIPLGDIGRNLSPYPYLLILGQDDNEKLLGESLLRWNVAVQWNTELVGLVQETDQVKATLKLPDGTTREATAAWLGGCDGAHSAVRELSRIAFQGAAYEDVFFVADTQMTGPMASDELNIYLWRRGFHLFFPMRGTDHWRIVAILPRELRDKTDLTFDDVMASMRKQAGPELVVQKCTWFSTYRIHRRRAQQFRDRRCFILGDAAHVHSPVGAQGMNTGLQDAYNLGWKLALVVAGNANARLLDSYEAERIPVAERLLSTTDRAFSVAVSDSSFAGFFRTRVLARVMAFAMHLQAVRKFVFLTISQTGISYRKSTLSQTLHGVPKSAPRAGDRFPWLRLKLAANAPVEDVYEKLDDTKFVLLVIGQPAPDTELQDLAGKLQTLVVPSDPENDLELARTRIPSPSFYLLRPDGYIGLAGTRFDIEATARYVSEHLQIGIRSA